MHGNGHHVHPQPALPALAAAYRATPPPQPHHPPHPRFPPAVRVQAGRRPPPTPQPSPFLRRSRRSGAALCRQKQGGAAAAFRRALGRGIPPCAIIFPISVSPRELILHRTLFTPRGTFYIARSALRAVAQVPHPGKDAKLKLRTHKDGALSCAVRPLRLSRASASHDRVALRCDALCRVVPRSSSASAHKQRHVHSA